MFHANNVVILTTFISTLFQAVNLNTVNNLNDISSNSYQKMINFYDIYVHINYYVDVLIMDGKLMNDDNDYSHCCSVSLHYCSINLVSKMICNLAYIFSNYLLSFITNLIPANLVSVINNFYVINTNGHLMVCLIPCLDSITNNSIIIIRGFDSFAILIKVIAAVQSKMMIYTILAIFMNASMVNIHADVCNLMVYSYYPVVVHYDALSNVEGNYFLVHYVNLMVDMVFDRDVINFNSYELSS